MNPLRAKRFEHGKTVADVAAGAGLSRHTVMRLELGATPLAPTAKALADYYGCKVTDLWPVEGDDSQAARAVA